MVINNLVDLVKHFQKSNIEVVEFTGWFIDTKSHGKWTLSHGVLKCDGNEVTSQLLDEILK